MSTLDDFRKTFTEIIAECDRWKCQPDHVARYPYDECGTCRLARNAIRRIDEIQKAPGDDDKIIVVCKPGRAKIEYDHGTDYLTVCFPQGGYVSMRFEQIVAQFGIDLYHVAALLGKELGGN